LLAKHPNINTLLYTSGFVTKQVNKIADIGEHRKWTDGRKKGTVTINGKEYKVIVLYSPSPNALRSITAEDRIKQYREVFGKRKTIYFAAQLETNPAVKSLFAVLKTHDVPFDFIKSTKDTWVRDFMPIQTKSGAWVSFRYEPSYHDTQAEIAKRTNYKRDINEQFSQFDITYSILNLDGGNIVFSPSKNKAIISDRIFIENKARTPKNLVRELEWRLETQVIIIPALKSDITGHADGMMRFVNENTVVVNKTNYENGLEQKIKKVLQSHGIEVIDFPYFDSKGDSAVGSYINFLETEQFIFLPVFDHDMDDEAITTAERLFDKQIIPVNINEIAENGGVLNCISWEQ
jgi:agmatine deiminase